MQQTKNYDFANQSPFDIRFEWGKNGVSHLDQHAGVVVIVDVLSFSTCVDVAVSRQGIVYPFPWNDDRTAQYAQGLNAELSVKRGEPGNFSLSPVSMLQVRPGTRIVLPSPNGAELSFSLEGTTKKLLTGSLRNSTAVADYLASLSRPILLIAAGERWHDGTLRPAVEDMIGAGSMIASLQGKKSPEALVAEAAWMTAQNRLEEFLLSTSSGRELTERGYRDDVLLAAELNVSSAVPLLRDKAFINAE